MSLESKYGALFFLVAIHVLYFIAAIRLEGIYLVDSYGYLHQAKNIAMHNTWYAEDWNAPLLVDYFSIRPPLYAWLIAVFQLFTSNIFVVLLVQNALSVLNLWMIYRFALEQGCDRRRAGVALILGTLFYPAQMIHANFVMTEIVFQTLLVGLTLSMIRFMFMPTWKKAIDLSALLALGFLTKPVSLFLPFIVLVLMSWKLTETRQWKFLLPLLFPALMFHAICAQQQHATGYYHYASIKSINQLKYNARYTLVHAEGEHEADSTIAAVMKVADAKIQYGERLRYMSSEANQIILYHPVDFALLFAKGVGAFFIDPGRFDLYHFFTIEEHGGSGGLLHQLNTRGISALGDVIAEAPIMILFLLLINMCWNICVVLAFVYFLTLKRVHLFTRVVVFLLVVYIAAASGPVGVSRYRVPVYPEMLLAVMFVFDTLFQPKRTADA